MGIRPIAVILNCTTLKVAKILCMIGAAYRLQALALTDEDKTILMSSHQQTIILCYINQTPISLVSFYPLPCAEKT